MQGVYFEDLPITSAAFVADGREAIVAGRGRHLYAVDLSAGQPKRIRPPEGREEKAWPSMALSPDGDWIALAGKDGGVVLLHARTKQVVGVLRMNRPGTAIAFDGASRLACGGRAGDVYVWDVRSRRCLCRFSDEGMSDTTAIAGSPDASTLAVGMTMSAGAAHKPAAL